MTRPRPAASPSAAAPHPHARVALALLLAGLALPPAALALAAPAAPPAQDAEQDAQDAEQDAAAEGEAAASDAEPAPAADDAPTHPGDALHAPYDTLLRNYVNNGWVDYTGLKREAAADLRAYLDALGETDPAALDRPATLAFWINAYNAFTLQLILEHLGEIDSIKDIPGSKRWDAKRWRVHGKDYSLDQIEHEILRPMGDARIHFGLVCASRSCPDLLSEAYLPSTLDEQLDRAARRFLADEFKGAKAVTESGWFGGEDPNLYLSKIFDWFEEDFERDGSVVDFVVPFLPEAEREYVATHRGELDVEYFDYDWSLNGG